MAKKKDPTTLTLEALAELGFSAYVVEVPQPGIRAKRDLLGFIDILALKPGGPILGIQATDNTNRAARRKKIQRQRATEARDWILAGGNVDLWTWKAKKVGDEWKYEANVEPILLNSLELDTPNGSR